MQLSVKELDGKLRIVLIDDNGVIHDVVDNITDGTLELRHIGENYYDVTVSFLVQS